MLTPYIRITYTSIHIFFSNQHGVWAMETIYLDTHKHTPKHICSLLWSTDGYKTLDFWTMSRANKLNVSRLFFLCVFVSAHIFCFPSSCWLVGVGDDKNFGAINPCRGALLRARAPGRSVHYAFSLRLRDEPGAVNCYTTTREDGVWLQPFRIIEVFFCCCVAHIDSSLCFIAHVSRKKKRSKTKYSVARIDHIYRIYHRITALEWHI